jgi:hypothetical protein
VQLERERQSLLASHLAIPCDLLLQCRGRGHESSIIQLPIADNCRIRRRLRMSIEDIREYAANHDSEIYAKPFASNHSPDKLPS